MRVEMKDLPPGLMAVVKHLGGEVWTEGPDGWHTTLGRWSAVLDACDGVSIVFVDAKTKQSALAALERFIRTVAKAVLSDEYTFEK
uniref:Uncharacterized protein n=1 Tax=viral metagenome TaxID=1070528 RepID=A0A6H1ZSP9_9ZZZZ